MLTIVFLLAALVLFVPVVRYLLSKFDEVEIMSEYVQGSDPTQGRPMTVNDGEAGRLVVDLRNLVYSLQAELRHKEGSLKSPDEPQP